MKRYQFDYSRDIHHIAVVGLGGTGSQLARSIARLLFDMRERRLQTPELMFIDPDVVEYKNVGRQMFTVADIGGNKAEILATRFNKALGLDILSLVRPFSPNAVASHLHTTLLVGCVDNPIARRQMAAAKILWLDTGNHYDTGQVILGNAYDVETVQIAMKKANGTSIITALPSPALVFPSLLEPDEPKPALSDLSCADLVQRGEQHLYINEFVALAASQYIYRLLHRQSISSHMSYVSADTGMIKPVLITSEIVA